MNEIETITPRQLRQILYHVQNQKMTVQELRELLYEAPRQDTGQHISFGMFERMLQAGRYDTSDPIEAILSQQ